jgi:hypothetical protein
MVLAWYDNMGKAVAVIDTFPSEDRTYSREPEGVGYGVNHYGRRLAIAVGDRWMATGMGDSFEIAFHDSAGALRRIARVPGLERPLDPAEKARYIEVAQAAAASFPDPDALRHFNREDLASRLPATTPVFAELRYDAPGNLWVRHYDFADAARRYVEGPAQWGATVSATREPAPDRRWTVLDPEGALLGDVLIPARFDVHEIGPDWMLGVWRDELDVQHVRIYRIRKPA